VLLIVSSLIVLFEFLSLNLTCQSCFSVPVLSPFLILVGLNLAKPKNSARSSLSNAPNCAGTRTKSSRFLFDHACCPDCTACSLGLSPPMRSKLRGKLFLRTFLLPGAPCCEFRPARRADCLPVLAHERPYFAGKLLFARVRPGRAMCSDFLTIRGGAVRLSAAPRKVPRPASPARL
jgi:hypothetical protein